MEHGRAEEGGSTSKDSLYVVNSTIYRLPTRNFQSRLPSAAERVRAREITVRSTDNLLIS